MLIFQLVFQTAPPAKKAGYHTCNLLGFDWLKNGKWENQQKDKESAFHCSRNLQIELLLFSPSQSYTFRYLYFVFLYLLITFSRA